MYRLWSSTGYVARVLKLTGVNLATIATASAIHTVVTHDYASLIKKWGTDEARETTDRAPDDSGIERRP